MEKRSVVVIVALIVLLLTSLGSCAYLVFERKGLLGSLQEKEEEIAAFVNQNKNLVEENESLRQAIEAKDKIQEAAGAKIAKLEQELKAKEDKLAELDKDTKEVAVKLAEVKVLKDENAALKTANAFLRQENDALKTRKKGWFGK